MNIIHSILSRLKTTLLPLPTLRGGKITRRFRQNGRDEAAVEFAGKSMTVDGLRLDVNKLNKSGALTPGTLSRISGQVGKECPNINVQ